MEKELAALTLDDDENEIEEGSRVEDSVVEETTFYLVGCFLTASIIHFPAMRITMANLWHLVKGVQIQYLGEKRFLFRFFYKMDLERVLNEAQCAFNNHLLLLHRLAVAEDPLKVPLLTSYFWVQIHDIHLGFFSKVLAKQPGNFIGSFIEYDNDNIVRGFRNYMRV